MEQTKKPNVQWHPAFAAAIQLTLGEERRCLKFQSEYNLATKPLQIDLLIIRKVPDVPIKNPIADFFRGHNLVEYKSPEDQLNEDTYSKTLAYAYLYKALEPRKDQIRLDDITLSLVRNGKPEKLLEFLDRQGYVIRTPQKGIYRFTKDGFFPSQIVVLNELGKREYLWLTSLRPGLEQTDAQALVDAARQLKEKEDREFADSVLDLTMRTNQQLFTIMKDKEGKTMCEAMMELMAPEIDALKREAEKAGEATGSRKAVRQSARNAFAAGLDFSLARQIAPTLSDEELRAIQAEVAFNR